MEAVHRFDRFEVRPLQRQLLVAGQPVALGARAFDLLLSLIERRGQLVTKSELLDSVWPGLVVEENNLTVQISTLRKLLGADVIATIPGRGYRFTVNVNGQPAAELPVSKPSPTTEPPSSIPTNLPDDLPALFGRHHDVQDLERMIEQHRLVTLVGSGGIGKTRLAQAVAHALRQRWPDGAWIIELAALTDPSLVPATVAQALGIRLGDQRPALDELLTGLRPQAMLLVLDNCEHLLGAVGALTTAIVAGAPHVRLLATSQEALKVAEEQQFRIAPLAVPAGSAGADAAGFGAIALFEARVRAVDRRFALDPSNLEAVVEICRRLDGLPLAIELAAVRVPVLGVQGVRAKLDARFQLLSGGSRMALRRHQTLRAALEWSHGLLAPNEQAVFRRLGVFAGGFSIELARAVAGDAEPGDEWAVIDALAALVDKSLVVAQPGDPPRYRLLESTRAYALEQLAAAGETALYLKRHALAVRALFERVHDALMEGRLNSSQLEEVLVPEVDNLRAAHQWASGPGANLLTAIDLAALGGALGEVATEVVGWLRALEPHLNAAGNGKSAAGFALAMARVTMRGFIAMPTQATYAERAAVLYDALDMPMHRFCCLWRAGYYRAELGEPEAARDAIAEAQRLLQPHWPASLRADLLSTTAFALLFDGQAIEKTLSLWSDAIDIYATGGDWLSEIGARNSMADAIWTLGRTEEARQRFAENVVALRKHTLASRYMSYALGNLMETTSDLERPDEAIVVAREALPFMRRCGLLRYFSDNFVYLLAQRGDSINAARLLGVSDAYLEGVSSPRQTNEQRLVGKASARMESVLSPQALQQYLNEGAGLSDDELNAMLEAALA